MVVVEAGLEWRTWDGGPRSEAEKSVSVTCSWAVCFRLKSNLVLIEKWQQMLF